MRPAFYAGHLLERRGLLGVTAERMTVAEAAMLSQEYCQLATQEYLVSMRAIPLKPNPCWLELVLAFRQRWNRLLAADTNPFIAPKLAIIPMVGMNFP